MGTAIQQAAMSGQQFVEFQRQQATEFALDIHAIGYHGCQPKGADEGGFGKSYAWHYQAHIPGDKPVIAVMLDAIAGDQHAAGSVDQQCALWLVQASKQK